MLRLLLLVCAASALPWYVSQDMTVVDRRRKPAANDDTGLVGNWEQALKDMSYWGWGMPQHGTWGVQQQAPQAQPAQSTWSMPSVDVQPAVVDTVVDVVVDVGKAPEGQACSKQSDCKMAGQTGKYDFHPDYDCFSGICLRYMMPGEYGCVEDRQCNTKCKETYCATDAKYTRNIDGARQCVCTESPTNPGRPMAMYANKCWKECPAFTSSNNHASLPECVATGSSKWQDKVRQFHESNRSKRQMQRIMC